MQAVLEEKKARYSRKKVLDFPWSSYQQDAIAFIQRGHGHGMIEAVAGSGKTKLLEGLVAATPVGSKVSVLAFNVHIAEELKRRIPASIASVGTAHAVGRALLIRYRGGELFDVNDRKYRDLCKSAVESLARPYREYWRLSQEQPKEADMLYPVPPPNVTIDTPPGRQYVRSLYRYLETLVHYAQVTLCSPDPCRLESMIEHYGILSDDDVIDMDVVRVWLLPLVDFVFGRGMEEAANGNIGLDDLIWLPEQWDIQPPPKHFLFVDETQDTNAAMSALYRRMAGSAGRIIAVGDKRQAIYGFAGSTTNAWDELKSSLNAKSLPLSTCYRCPASHLRLAKVIVPQIEPCESAPEGQIAVLNPKLVYENVQSGDLILCRLTAPLVSLCLRLVTNNKKAQVRGRNIGEQLAALAKSATEDVAFPREFLPALENYCSPRIAVYLEAQDEMKAEALQDRWAALVACFEYFGLECRSLVQFCKRVEALFCDDGDRPPIILSTIHRAKGDEASRVFLLGSNLMPFTGKCKQEWQLEQEWNLVYVALTRCKWDKSNPSSGTLFFVPIPKRRGEAISPADLEDPLGGLQLWRYKPEPSEAVLVETTKATPIHVGDTVHLKGIPNRHYNVIGIIPANKSSNETLELIAPEGGKAYWHTAQMVRVDSGKHNDLEIFPSDLQLRQMPA